MKRAIFIGQAMPRSKKDPHDWPSLNSWLYSINISRRKIEKSFFYSALVDYYPGSKNGSHRVPTRGEIFKEKSRLKSTISDFEPDIIVPVGKLSISYCLQRNSFILTDVVGRTFFLNPYGLMNRRVLTIPFPHPSGASTWYNKPKHKKLVSKALSKLKENL